MPLKRGKAAARTLLAAAVAVKRLLARKTPSFDVPRCPSVSVPDAASLSLRGHACTELHCEHTTLSPPPRTCSRFRRLQLKCRIINHELSECHPFTRKQRQCGRALSSFTLVCACTSRLNELPARQLGVMALVQKNADAYLGTHDDVMTHKNDKPCTFKNVDDNGVADGSFG